MTELLTFSKKSGWVSSWSVGTGSNSEPASPKYVVKKLFSSVLFWIGLVRLLNAARTSSSGRVVGLAMFNINDVNVKGQHLQIYEGLRI